MESKPIELFITEKTLDVTEIFKGFSTLYVEIARGNLWFFKDQLQKDDAVRIREGKIYILDGVVQIQNMGRGKSAATLYGTLMKA